MTYKIYVEGGGPTEATQGRCRRGFAEYCKRVAPNLRLSVVACGSREDTFARFKTSVGRNIPDELCILLVDSEGPVRADTEPAAYLHAHDRWNFVDLPVQHVFLMVQAMEAWFFADRACLAGYYGTGFRPRALVGDEMHVETIPKDDLYAALIAASRDTRTKGRYQKASHAFDLLAEIDPLKVELASPHAARFHRFLRFG